MRTRPAVSLIEVLVALVLLGIGVSGTLASLSAAQRLRDSARAREELAARASDRLDWFLSAGCAVGDTGSAADTAGRVITSWRQRDSSGLRLLDVRAHDAARRVPSLRVGSRRRCD